MLVIFLILRKYLNFFTKPFPRQIEEENEESPIKKLPSEVFGAIFEKLEYEDVQKLKNSSKFLFDAHKLERRMIAGPKCNANVYYNKNKELRLEITIFVEVRWIRILPFKRTIELTRTIPFDQWNYYFKNAKCKILRIIVEEDEIPLDILKKIICCKSIDILTYSGKSINQMSIDLLAAYNSLSFGIVVDRWCFRVFQNVNFNHTFVIIHCFENIDDIFEAIKFTYDSIISFQPEIYEKNEVSFMKLKPNIEHYPHYFFIFTNYTNIDEEKVQSIANFLENNVSNVYGYYVKSKVFKDGTDLHITCRDRRAFRMFTLRALYFIALYLFRKIVVQLIQLPKLLWNFVRTMI